MGSELRPGGQPAHRPIATPRGYEASVSHNKLLIKILKILKLGVSGRRWMGTSKAWTPYLDVHNLFNVVL